MKLENKENWFKSHSEYDRKNKLNRSKVLMTEAELNQIEKGVTIENIDELSKKVKIFKYQTQITIHGKFPEIGCGCIFGYKHVFQNKNKSVGIRYGCVDETKRQYLSPRLKTIGFSYSRNSVKQSFNIFKK